MEISKKLAGTLLFSAGVIIGLNYPKIRKQVAPVMKKIGKKTSAIYTGVSKFLATQKEKIEDLCAKKKSAHAVVAAKGRGRKPLTAKA